MRIRLTQKARLLFLIFILSVTWSVRINAQAISFVQITDPHLFDGGKEGAENKVALTACIKKLNERVDEHAGYQFAVVTGDIGIENLVSHVIDEATGRRVLEDQETRDRQLEAGADQLATTIALSKIRVWLFLPGNNDLFKEEPDTQYYRAFIKKLQSKLPGLIVIDLCPEEPADKKQELGLYRIGSHAFIGFNNASFKNDNDTRRVSLNKKIQRDYVQQVIKRVDALDVADAFVFYHIPEIDDPHIVLNSDDQTPKAREAYADNPYPDSSWFVDKEIQKLWKDKVVKNTKVHGLFAGHLHDWRQETYSGSLAKLYVCPPLAIKRQDKTLSQARGFQEVSIDGSGRISRTILWYNPAEGNFGGDPSAENNELQLALFFEGEQQWSDAESHFREAAAKAQSPSDRNAALAGLKRVKDPSHPRVKAMLGWTDPVFLAPYVLRPLGLTVIVLVIWLLYVGVRDGSRGMIVRPFEGDDGLAKLLAVGFPATRAKVMNILGTADQSFVKPVIGVYPFVFPRLDELFPQESFELVGIKLPNLNILLKWLVRPRFQVIGGISELSVDKYVYAEVWRRKWWFGTELIALTTREIPSGYYTGRVELENFILDVYLRAYATA
jgi:hypothetical protein